MVIKAIETHYKGYKFRSRLEARWAVFFDSAEIPWEYEKEGYVLSNGECYLPDFYLPKAELFVEVKGEKPEFEYFNKLADFGMELKKNILVVIGIPESEYEKIKFNCELFCYNPKENIAEWVECAVFINPLALKRLWFCTIDCDFEVYTINEKYKMLSFRYEDVQTYDDLSKRAYVCAKITTDQCISAMKQARFEHGEKPLRKKMKGKKK